MSGSSLQPMSMDVLVGTVPTSMPSASYRQCPARLSNLVRWSIWIRGPHLFYITGTARPDLVVELYAGRFLECVDHFQHGITFARTDVEHIVVAVGVTPFEQFD